MTKREYQRTAAELRAQSAASGLMKRIKEAAMLTTPEHGIIEVRAGYIVIAASADDSRVILGLTDEDELTRGDEAAELMRDVIAAERS